MDRLSAIFKGAGKVTDNQIEVIASTTGNIDRSGDVLAPGAFKSPVLRDFVENGAILVGHEWDDLPIGMPVSASVSNDQIISIAQFHNTDKGQEARTVAMERMEAGKSVSVSVGFMPDYDSVEWYESGKKMLESCEEKGMDMTKFDVNSIRKWAGSCRLIRSVSELFEWSIVLVGMNPRAKTISVKSGESLGISLEEHLSLSLAGMKRTLEVAELRSLEDRKLSDERLQVVKDIRAIADSVLAFTTKSDVDPDELERRRLKVAEVEKQLQKWQALNYSKS